MRWRSAFEKGTEVRAGLRRGLPSSSRRRFQGLQHPALEPAAVRLRVLAAASAFCSMSAAVRRSTNQATKARRRLTPGDRSDSARQSFRYQLRGENGKSSDVAAGVREAGHKTFTHGIAKVEGDDWNGCGRPTSGMGCGVTERSNEVDPETNKIGSQIWKSLDPPFGRPVFEDDALPFDVPEFAQAFFEGVEQLP